MKDHYSVINCSHIENYFLDENNTFQLVKEALQKSFRDLKDKEIIKEYIKNCKEFNHILKEKHDNYKGILSQISTHLKYSFYSKNNLIFRTGDLSNNFYIILEGKVCVLLAKEEKIHLSDEEYRQYLLKLKKYNENELISLNIVSNRGVFDYDPYLDSQFQMKNNLTPNKQEKKNKRKSGYRLLMNQVTLIENIKDLSEVKTLIITPEEYINRIKPVTITDLNSEKKIGKVWIYYNIVNLNKGEVFGDYGFIERNQKRTASIITETECHLGVLDKTFFLEYLKDFTEKLFKEKEAFFLLHHTFEGYDNKGFFKRFYQYFVNEKFSTNQILVNQGEIANYIYFIKKGDYDVSVNCNLLEIDEFINNYRMIISRKSRDLKLKQSVEKMKNEDVYKFLLEKKNFKFSIISKNDIVGMEDIVYKNKHIFTITCQSLRGEVYKIKKEFLDEIINSDGIIKNNFNKFLLLRFKFLKERFMNIRDGTVKSYKQIKLNGRDPLLLELYGKIKCKTSNTVKVENNKYKNFLDNLNKKQQEILDKNISNRKNYFDEVYKTKLNRSNLFKSPLNLKKQSVHESYSPDEFKLTTKKSSQKNTLNRINSVVSHISEKNVNLSLLDLRLKANTFGSFVFNDNILQSNRDLNSESKTNVIDCLAYEKFNRVMFNIDKTLSNCKSSIFIDSNLKDSLTHWKKSYDILPTDKPKSLNKTLKPYYFLMKNKEKKILHRKENSSNSSKFVNIENIPNNLRIFKIKLKK